MQSYASWKISQLSLNFAKTGEFHEIPGIDEASSKYLSKDG